MLSVYTYMLIVGQVRLVTSVTKQSSSVISDVFSNACFFVVYILRFFFFWKLFMFFSVFLCPINFITCGCFI